MRWSLAPRTGPSSKKAEWLKKLYEEGHIKTPPKTEAQEPPPSIFPDLYWIWEAYCFLNERRGIGPAGPTPITATDILAYCQLVGRETARDKQQLVRLIPPLDRFFLKDFYDRQQAETEKQMKSVQSKSRRH